MIPGLDKTEFERFTAKIPYAYDEKLLHEMGLYEFEKGHADKDGIISYEEFRKVIVNLIEMVKYSDM